jgi:predicted nucleic acid-binding protein
MIAVDSAVWIDRFNGIFSEAVQKLDSRLNSELIAIGDIVLLEVLQGARDEMHARNLHRIMSAFVIVGMLDPGIALRCAANYRLLRSKGITIRKTPDLIIGTWCIENNVPLLHNDRDFRPMVEHLGLIEY